MPSDESEVTRSQLNNAASSASAPIAAVLSSGTRWRCRPCPGGVWRKRVCRKAAVALLAVLSCALFLKDAVWQSKSLREFDDSAQSESSTLLAAAYGTYASHNLTVQFVEGMAAREHWPLAWREGCVTFTRGCGPRLEARIRVPREMLDQLQLKVQAGPAPSIGAESAANAAAAAAPVTAAVAATMGHTNSTSAIAGGEGHAPGRGSSAANGTARCASDVRQLVCVLDSANTKGLPHVAHLAQSFFPCWSLFLGHPRRDCVILLNDSYTSHGARKAGRYATDLAAAMGAHLVTLEATAGLCGTGTGLQGHLGGGMQWFDRGGDAAALRDAVLALPRQRRWSWPPSSWLPLPGQPQQQRSEVSGDATNLNFKLKLDNQAEALRVGLLNRAIASGRHLVHHAAIAAAVAAYHGAHGQAVEVEHAVMDGRTLRQQAEWFSALRRDRIAARQPAHQRRVRAPLRGPPGAVPAGLRHAGAVPFARTRCGHAPLLHDAGGVDALRDSVCAFRGACAAHLLHGG
ncbi:hypothetical protein JKP88DRAFT_255392 [Tribonema minus]|uniref:Uncharacterized protein n=1 Tax=Tribonema minus TaxID=303371 RepID=A0A835Z935_9STRA|nr:hypothetical protein JKP88DRAFT_255392 [Tribonema minus]